MPAAPRRVASGVADRTPPTPTTSVAWPEPGEFESQTGLGRRWSSRSLSEQAGPIEPRLRWRDDFDALLQDPAHPNRLLLKWDSGDHLHPGDAGYRHMGDAFDVSLLK